MQTELIETGELQRNLEALLFVASESLSIDRLVKLTGATHVDVTATLGHIAETFADSLGQSTFDGQTMRVELCVTRQTEAKPGEGLTAKRYITARLVLTPEAAVELFNVCTQMVGALKNAGVLKETPAQQAAPAPRN